MNKVSFSEQRPSALMVDTIVQYAGWRLTERGSSAESVRAYERCLYRVADDHPEITLPELEAPKGTEYLRQSIVRHWGHTSKSTRAKNISYIRSFFRWCFEENLMQTDPSQRLSRPRHATRRRRRPTEDEMLALLEAAAPHEVPAVLMLGWLGLRASEAVSIRWQHVDFTRHEITVPIRKGGAPGSVRLYDDVRHRLHAAYVALEPRGEDHLFVAKSRRYVAAGVQGEELKNASTARTRAALYLLVRRLCLRAEVGPFVDSEGDLYYYGPHSLRHGAATRWLKAGARIDSVQAMLAHSQIATTKKYLDELEPEAIEDDLNRALGPKLSEGGVAAIPVPGVIGDEATRAAPSSESLGVTS